MFKIAHQILMIFAQMLEIVALSVLASLLCARKFSLAPRGVYPKLPFFIYYYYFIIIIIIFKALRLAAVVFMCFFNLAAAERPQHCALVVKNGPFLAVFRPFSEPSHFYP